MVIVRVRFSFMVRVSFSVIVVQPQHRYFLCIPLISTSKWVEQEQYCSIARVNDLVFCYRGLGKKERRPTAGLSSGLWRRESRRHRPDGCRLVLEGNSAAVLPIAAAPEFGGIATALRVSIHLSIAYISHWIFAAPAIDRFFMLWMCNSGWVVSMATHFTYEILHPAELPVAINT